MSRTAIHARPMPLRTIFLAARVMMATTDKVSRYFLTGESMAMPNTSIGGAEITPELE